MADTMSGRDAAGSTSDSWSTRLRRRRSWRLRRRVHLDARHERDQVGPLHLHRRDVGDDPALAEDHDPVGEAEDLLEVVGDEQHAGALGRASRRRASRTRADSVTPSEAVGSSSTSSCGSGEQRAGQGDELLLPPGEHPRPVGPAGCGRSPPDAGRRWPRRRAGLAGRAGDPRGRGPRWRRRRGRRRARGPATRSPGRPGGRAAGWPAADGRRRRWCRRRDRRPGRGRTRATTCRRPSRRRGRPPRRLARSATRRGAPRRHRTASGRRPPPAQRSPTSCACLHPPGPNLPFPRPWTHLAAADGTRPRRTDGRPCPPVAVPA